MLEISNIAIKVKLWWGFLLSYGLPHFFNPSPSPSPPGVQPGDLVIAIPESSTPPTSLPPNDDNNTCAAPNNIAAAVAEEYSSPTTIHEFNSIVVMMRELELGKSFLNIGLPIITAVLISINDSRKFHSPTFAFFMLSGIAIGSMAIWNGIVLRTTFRRSANVIEQLGVVMFLLSFTGLLASQLPSEFIWPVTILCCDGIRAGLVPCSPARLPSLSGSIDRLRSIALFVISYFVLSIN